ncbi:MAG: PAS domain-containing protein [Pseudolabrys sp.]|nr:PAS domain-containing protein [Pseudolabrys sp.]
MSLRRLFDHGKAHAIARTLAQPVTYLGVAMLVAIYGVLVFLIVSDRHEAERGAKRQGDNLVRIIDKSYSHIFQSVDATLLFLRNSYQQSPAGFSIANWIDASSAKNDLTFNFVIVDGKGKAVDATYTAEQGSPREIVGADFSQRDYFLHQMTSSLDELYISAPFPLKISGTMAIVVSRRVTAPDGTFGGVVVALINPSELGKAAVGLNLGANGTFGLVGRDGIVRTRIVNGKLDVGAAGRQLPSDSGLLTRAARAPADVFWNAPERHDGVSRLVSYRALENFPLIAFVAIAEAEIFRHANGQAMLYWSIALMLTLAILIAIRSGMAHERKLKDAVDGLLRAQDTARRGEERYRLVEAAVNDGIWDWNIVDGTDYRSPRWNAIVGYGDDEIGSRNSMFIDLIHPDDRPRVAEATRAHLDEDKPYDLEFRLRHKNGEYRWVHSRGKALRDETNRPVRMLGSMTDVTERRRAEAAVNESHTNLERAERMALLGHYKIDRATGTLIWSDGIYRIYGLSPDKFTPTLRGTLELIHPDDRHFLEEIRHNAMAGQEIPHVTLRAFRSDGAPIDVEYWATPVRDHDGLITGVFGTLQDITIRKRAEETLARANQELEARVGERTAELAKEMRRREEAQMTLGQMQKMEAVGQLTAGIAHDFNNLLAVIGGSLEFVDSAAARGLTAEPELIDAALRATRRGRELVRRLLAFSRQSPLRAEATNIDQLVLDTLRLLQRTLGQGIDMVTQLDAKAAVISVDRNQLANALLNLALNARDAMPDGGQLIIATRCQPVTSESAAGSPRWPLGEEVLITISDSGAGMTDEVRSRAFEPFFTTKADGLGSGLGLSMVQGFVEQSGGKIEIESSPGNGTTITITLPRVASESRSDEADLVPGTSAPGREKTVLLVEDDPDVRVVTAAQLRHLGYKVHAVANGMDAIDLIASPANIDITLTDIVLPGGFDGVALVKEAMRARPNMGVLCMSGYDPTQKHRKWLKVQNINFLEKPFSSTRLAQALDAALAH